MRSKLFLAVLVACAVVAAVDVAAAQEQLTGEDQVSDLYNEELYRIGEGLQEFGGPDGLFADSSGTQFEIPAGDLWTPTGFVAVTWGLTETVPGPSTLVPGGFFFTDGFLYSGVAPANDLETDTMRSVAVQTDSMFDGCEGVRREVAVSVARPGLATYTSDDEFVGNPGIGHNLQISFILNDCLTEAFYLELVDGEFQSFQSRIGVVYFDDGESTTVVFVGATPTLDGPFTVSTAESPVPFSMEATYGFTSGQLDWPDGVPFSNQPGISLDALADRGFLLTGAAEDVPDSGDSDGAGSDDTESDGQEGAGDQNTETEGEVSPPEVENTSTDTDSEGSFPVVPVVVGGSLAAIVSAYVWSRLREDAQTDEVTPGPYLGHDEMYMRRVADQEEKYEKTRAERMITELDEAVTDAADTAIALGARTTDDGWVYIDEKAWTQGTSMDPMVDVYLYDFEGNRYTPSGGFFFNISTRQGLLPRGIADEGGRTQWIGLCWTLNIDPEPGLRIIDENMGRPAPVPPPEPDPVASTSVSTEQADPESSAEWHGLVPLGRTPTSGIPAGSEPEEDSEEDDEELFGAVDMTPRPANVNLTKYGLQGDEATRFAKLDDIVEKYRGTGDIAGVAEELFDFNEWNKQTFDEAWFTWTNDQNDQTLIRATTVDDFLTARQMCCYEFVHLCAYIASDQMARPRLDNTGTQVAEAPIWGLKARLFDAGTGVPSGANVPRGAPITAVHKYWEGNKAGYFHVAISLGDGNVIGLGSGGLEKESVAWCFNPMWYQDLEYSYYQYGAQNPAPGTTSGSSTGE